MKFFYDYAPVPCDPATLEALDGGAKVLSQKLEALDLTSLPISDYNRRYLGEKLHAPVPTLQLYAYILAWSLAGCTKPLSRVVLLDYGGGSGVFSLLARACGIGTVFYNDIYPVSCSDAETLGASIGLAADAYIAGDIDDAIPFVRARGVDCDAVASFDVIEHVYDIEHFLRRLPDFSKGALTIVMSSSANGRNPSIRRDLMKIQREAELVDRQPQWGCKERDSLRSYLATREDIIRAYLTEIGSPFSEVEVRILAQRTRGKIAGDIRKAVHDFVETGRYPSPLPHPTNTCDPHTGNWAEHLMPPHHLIDVLSREGLEARVASGFWWRPSHPLKRIASQALNIGIRGLGPLGLILAPFYTIYARRNGAVAKPAGRVEPVPSS